MARPGMSSFTGSTPVTGQNKVTNPPVGGTTSLPQYLQQRQATGTLSVPGGAPASGDPRTAGAQARPGMNSFTGSGPATKPTVQAPNIDQSAKPQAAPNPVVPPPPPPPAPPVVAQEGPGMTQGWMGATNQPFVPGSGPGDINSPNNPYGRSGHYDPATGKWSMIVPGGQGGSSDNPLINAINSGHATPAQIAQWNAQNDVSGGMPAPQANGQPGAVGLENLRAVLERGLANNSRYSGDLITRLQDQMSGNLNDERRMAEDRAKADASARGVYYGSPLTTSLGDIGERYLKAQSSGQTDLLKQIADANATDKQSSIDNVFRFGQGEQDSVNSQNDLLTRIADLGLRGGPTIPGATDSFNSLPQPTAPDYSSIYQLLGSLFGGGTK